MDLRYEYRTFETSSEGRREVSEDFKRQMRYIVLKNNDVSRALDADQHRELLALCAVVSEQREIEGKQPMQCVVVESDWSIYEQVWKLVELEAQGAEQPASEDAWRHKIQVHLADIIRNHGFANTAGRDSAKHKKLADEAETKLWEVLLSRPAREGFVSVNEQTIRAAAEVMEKEFANLGNFSCTKEVWADKIRGWLFIREPVESSLRKAMIEAAKGDGE